MAIKLIVLGLLVVSICLNVIFRSATYDLSDRCEIMKHELDSIYAEVDTLADIKKTMIVAYPQLTKWEAMCYAPIIREFTKTYRTPFPLALSFVGVESGWNPTLVSTAKCRGLGQLSAAAAKEGSARIGISYKEGYTEWVEPLNLALSLHYLCSRYANSGREFAIKSYVGGNNFRRTEAANGKNAKYIKEYAQLIEREELKVKNMLAEADKLTYIYKGILYERIVEYPEMSCTQRTLVCRMQKQNPTRTGLSMDSSTRDSSMSELFKKTNEPDKDGFIRD